MKDQVEARYTGTILRASIRYVSTAPHNPWLTCEKGCSGFQMAEEALITDRKRLEALAPVAVAPIRHHVFVCTGKSCSAVDSAEVKAAFERELLSREMLFGKEKKGKNPRGSVVLTECSSVGFCAIGAAVMVYPDGVWYAQVRAENVPEIVEEHLVHGRVVERLALLKVPSEGKAAGARNSRADNWEA